jgi:hypothetical protein
MPMRGHPSGEIYRGLRKAPDTAQTTAAAREQFNEVATSDAVLVLPVPRRPRSRVIVTASRADARITRA